MTSKLCVAMICLVFGGSNLLAVDGAWNVDSNGLWSVGSNWLSNSVPGGAGSAVVFTNALTAQRTVTVNAPVVVGRLSFKTPAPNNNWRLIGVGPLALDNNGSAPIIESTVNNLVEIQTPLSGTDGFLQRSAGDIEFSGVNTGLSGMMELRDLTVKQSMSKSAASSDFTVQNQFPTSGVILAGARLDLYGRKNANATSAAWIMTTGSATITASNGVTSAALAPGQVISGSGIPEDTYVKTIVDGTTLVLSTPATQSTTSTLSFAAAAFNSKQLFQRLRPDAEKDFVINKNGGTSFELEVENLYGNANLYLNNGDGTLKIPGQRNHRGSLKMNGPQLTLAPKTVARQPAANPAFHVDASKASTLTLNGNEVSEWADVNNNGWVAKAPGTKPTLMANALNGLPVVDFGPWGGSQYMWWNFNNVETSMTDIRTVFVVIGSQNGGANLLSDKIANHFHRGTDINNGFNPGQAASKIIAVGNGGLNQGWSDIGNSLSVFVDGAPASPHDSFDGGYQLISCRSSTNAIAGGFANDRNIGGREGGQRLAEVIVYNRALTELEKIQTEEYLTAKWFPERWDVDGKDPYLTDLVSTGSRVVNTPDTGAVTFRKLSGYGTLTKNGQSALQIDDAQDFTGTIALNAGELHFDVSKVPSEPASNAYFHVDASIPDSFVLNGSGGVISWSDLRGNGRAASVAPGINSPTLVTNGLNSMPFVDFGSGGSLQSLVWNHTNSAMRAIFMVFESKFNSAFLLGHHEMKDFHRDGVKIYHDYHASRTTMCGLNTINGHRVEGKDAIMPSGFNVIGVQALTPGARASNFAKDRNETASTGGQRLAEVIIYNHPLTDQERRDTEAYLMYKWLNRSAPGYGAASAPLVAKIAPAVGDLSVQVAGDGTAAIGELATVVGNLNKSGSGTLAFATGDSGFAGKINVNEGGISSIAPGDAAPAAGAAFHVDASQTNTFTFSQINGTNFITNWRSIGYSGMFAQQRGSFALPYLRTNDLAGLPVVDFGKYGSAGACLQWSSRIANIRTVFSVFGSQDGGGFILGDTLYPDFHRGGATIDGGIVVSYPMFGWDRSMNVRSGRVYLDSNYVENPDAQSLSGGWQLIEVQTTGDTRADLFAADRNFAARLGGQRLAEVIIYDRALSEPERVQTENYLNKKWFGKTRAGAGLGTVVVQSDTGLEADAAAMRVNTLVGDADIVKSGADVLTLADTTSYTGIVEVIGGTLNLATPAAPLTPPASTLFWVDASRPETMKFDAAGSVTNWSDVTGNGRYAYPTADTRKPRLRGSDFAGLPVMDFGPYGTAAGRSMYWNQRINGMKTVIWVLGSQASGGYLLGTTDVAKFHRGPPPPPAAESITVATMSYRNKIFKWDAVRPTTAYVDRLVVDPWNTELSGGYQILIFTYSGGNYADGFAFDRAFGDRHGGQRLAEFIAYDRVLTTGEIMDADAYLRAKWLGEITSGYTAPATDIGVILHENTMLTMNGAQQSVTSLAGSGSVANGTLVVTGILSPGMNTGERATIPVSGNLTLAAGATYAVDVDAPASDLVAVSGSLEFGSSGSVVANVAEPVVTGSYAVMTYGSVVGASNLSSWTVTGLPGGYTGRLTASNGTVYLNINASGTLIIVR